MLGRHVFEVIRLFSLDFGVELAATPAGTARAEDPATPMA